MGARSYERQTNNMSLKVYVRNKIKVLKELDITLSDYQIEHMKSLKNEIQIDNYAHDIITKKK